MGRSLSFAGASAAAVTVPGQVVDTSQSFTVHGSGGDFTYTAPPNSLTVVTVKD
jgi:hypothetical protein